MGTEDHLWLPSGDAWGKPGGGRHNHGSGKVCLMPNAGGQGRGRKMGAGRDVGNILEAPQLLGRTLCQAVGLDIETTVRY